MNTVRLQLYQVYVRHDDKQLCFHIQSDNERQFKIMGENICPKEYVHLESTFNDAVHKLGETN